MKEELKSAVMTALKQNPTILDEMLGHLDLLNTDLFSISNRLDDMSIKLGVGNYNEVCCDDKDEELSKKSYINNMKEKFISISYKINSIRERINELETFI